MAKNLHLLAIVSIVAVVGIVVMLTNSGSGGLLGYDITGEAFNIKMGVSDIEMTGDPEVGKAVKILSTSDPDDDDPDYDDPESSGTDDDDPDHDGLDDGEEFKHRTDPSVADTDGDGAKDGIEVIYGTDPLDSADYPMACAVDDDCGTGSCVYGYCLEIEEEFS
jgi:hypothetical protein